MVGYVYIRTNELCGSKNVVKLGITATSPQIREYGYNTYEHKKGYYIAIYEISIANIKFIDNLLKYEFKGYNDYIDAGTEYYNPIIIDKIEPYLKSIQIDYKIINIEEMEALQREDQFQQIKESLQKKGILQKWNEQLFKKLDQIQKRKSYLTDGYKISDCISGDWSPRDYQIRAIEYGYQQLLQNNKFYLELPTGGGKSYIVYNILQQLIEYDFDLDLILIISPRVIVNNQNVSEKYTQLLNQKCNIYNYSDGNKKKFNTFIQKTTIQKNTIQKNTYVKKEVNILIVCTSSVNKIYDQLKHLKMCIWFDEAHHGIESWILSSQLKKEKKETVKKETVKKETVKKEIKKKENNEERWLHIGKYNIFTSASPDKQFILKNEEIFGELYAPIKVSELIQLNWLCTIIPYVYMEDKQNINKIKFMLHEFTDKHRNYGFSFHNSRANAFELFYFHYLEYQNGKTAIKPFLLVGTFSEEHIEILKAMSNIDLDYDYTNIQVFENTHLSIGYVVAKYSMGYDFKLLDFIAFNDPKLSFKDIIQCIGRGIRPDCLGSNGANLNKYLMILLPIYYNEVESSETVKYKNIKKVLQYLLHDVELNFSDIWFVDRISRNSETKNSETKGEEYNYYQYSENDNLYDGKYRKLSDVNVLSIVLNLLEKKEDRLEIKNHDFTSSTIQFAILCLLNIEHKPSKLKYKTIRDVVYRLIGNSNTIIQNTTLNIIKEKKTDKGFDYMEDLHISVQGVDSNSCIYEIISQCKKNNIGIQMQIKLKNNKVIDIVY